MNPEKRWAVIPGTEGLYYASDHGDVWSVRAGRCMVPRIQSRTANYRIYGLSLYLHGAIRSTTVHRLVLEAFVGPSPLVVRHLDGDAMNNRLSNLAYGTMRENAQDMLAHGTHNQARKTHCKWGHEYTPENTRVNRDRHGVKRTCRTCVRETARKAAAS